MGRGILKEEGQGASFSRSLRISSMATIQARAVKIKGGLRNWSVSGFRLEGFGLRIYDLGFIGFRS